MRVMRRKKESEEQRESHFTPVKERFEVDQAFPGSPHNTEIADEMLRHS